MSMVVQLTEVTVEQMGDTAQDVMKKEVAWMVFGDTNKADLVTLEEIRSPEESENRRRQLIEDNSSSSVGSSAADASDGRATSSTSGVDITVILSLAKEDDEDLLAKELETSFNNGTFLEELKALEKKLDVNTFENSKLKAYIIYGNADIRVGGSSQEEPRISSFEDAIGSIFRPGSSIGNVQIPWAISWLAALATLAFVIGSYLTYRKVVSRKRASQKPAEVMRARDAGIFMA